MYLVIISLSIHRAPATPCLYHLVLMPTSRTICTYTYSSLDFIQDYLDELVPEETFTHSHHIHMLSFTIQSIPWSWKWKKSWPHSGWLWQAEGDVKLHNSGLIIALKMPTDWQRWQEVEFTSAWSSYLTMYYYCAGFYRLAFSVVTVQ